MFFKKSQLFPNKANKAVFRQTFFSAVLVPVLRFTVSYRETNDDDSQNMIQFSRPHVTESLIYSITMTSSCLLSSYRHCDITETTFLSNDLLDVGRENCSISLKGEAHDSPFLSRVMQPLFHLNVSVSILGE